MKLSVPVGTIGTDLDRVRVMVSGWSVRNDGTVEGYVGGRLLLQVARFLVEDTIIDGGWVPGLPVTSTPQGRLAYDVPRLSAVVSSAIPRRAIVWDPTPYRVRPGATVQLSFNLLIGIELLAGLKNIDIVAIAERLDGIQALKDSRGNQDTRWSDAFSVAEAGPPAPVAFTPVLLGTAGVQVNPF